VCVDVCLYLSDVWTGADVLLFASCGTEHTEFSVRQYEYATCW